MSTPQPDPAPRQPAPLRLLRVLTLLVSNAIKLGGLYITVHEIATQPQPRLSVIAVALFMMSGAEVSEDTVITLVSRMFGAHTEHRPKR